MNPSVDSPPLLEMLGIGKHFGATQALAGVDFVLRPGEVHALVGENGAGKSTLIKILSGALYSDSGRMRIRGRNYAPASPLDGRRAGIAVIYQELNLAPHLTVLENIMLGREIGRSGFLDRRAMRRAARDSLDLVHHPEIDLDIPIRNLGAGARQIVEIARALAGRAEILVMDEPTSSLNKEDAQRLFSVIRTLRTRGVGIVYISHFLEEVRDICDVLTVLRDGRKAGSGPIADFSMDEIIRLMVGRKIGEMFPRRERRTGEVVLRSRRLKSRNMASEVSLELRSGEILGIAGLIGSGRTEFLRALFGLDDRTGGVMEIRGGEVPPLTPGEGIRRGLGFLSEDRQGEGLALSLSVADNLTLGRFSPFVRTGLLRPGRQKKAVADWMRKMTVKARGPAQKVSALSGGNQQKVALARLLHQESRILLLDEPTRGIDVVSKTQIYEWIAALAAEGKSVIFVSSHFPELLGVCDRIAVFHRGLLVEERDVSHWDMEALTARAVAGFGGGENPVQA
jgi:ribose transport system ATP-binding protein